MNALHEAALRYLPRSLPLEGKRPRLADWPRRVATRELVDEWWTRWPTANVGLRTGDGLAVLDLDPRHGSVDALAELEAVHGALPWTPEVATGGGGRHLYFRAAGPLRSCDLAPGIELKAEGRQVVAPPSVHPDTGRPYVWQPRSPFRADPRAYALLPAWVRALAEPAPAAPAAPSPRPQRDDDDPLRAIPAAEYVPTLTGRPLDRGGYLRCPLHGDGQERTPSLLAGGRDPALWHCFGCGAGGSIYDLTARLAGYPLPLRGPAFLAVRDELTRYYDTTRQAVG